MSAAYTISTLPKEYTPFLLGNPACKSPPAGLEDTVRAALDNLSKMPTLDKKPYVHDCGEWIIKGERILDEKSEETLQAIEKRGLPTLRPLNTHLTRATQAQKVAAFIKKHQLEGEFAVPQKYLYWDTNKKKFYCISKKLKLADLAPSPKKEYIDSWRTFEEVAKLPQIVNAFNGKTRDITPTQASALARMSFELGYTDLTFQNMYFTPEGKIAIIDTEDVKAPWKRVFQTPLNQFFQDSIFIKPYHGVIGTGKLRASCSKPEALKEITKVEKKVAAVTLLKVVAKIALVALAVFSISLIPVTVPLVGIALTVAKAVLIAKGIFLATNTFTFLGLWHLSSNRGIVGLGRLTQMEMKGMV